MVFGNIHLTRSSLTWDVCDYKFFITIIASRQFGVFLSFEMINCLQKTLVTANFNWNSVAEWREQDFKVWRDFYSIRGSGKELDSLSWPLPIKRREKFRVNFSLIPKSAAKSPSDFHFDRQQFWWISKAKISCWYVE